MPDQDQELRDLIESSREDEQGNDGALPEDPDLTQTKDRAEFQGTYRLTDELAVWFGESFKRWAQGEQIIWDISIMAMPDPETRGMFHPSLVIALATKGMVLNSIVYRALMQQPFGLSREVVDSWCKELVAELLNGRSEQVAAMEAESAQAAAQNRIPESRGLILPGN